MRGLLGVILALGAVLAPLAARAQISEEDLISMAERVVSHGPALSTLWPGFWPPDQPFILYAPEVGAVFSGAASPEGLSFRPGPLENATFHFMLNFPSGVPNTVLLDVTDRDDDLSTLFHEQFHDFQSEAFRWPGDPGGEYVDLDLIDDMARFTAVAELERQILASALEAADGAERRVLARDYLTLRRHREQGLDASIILTERHREWLEGTAEYVGRQAAALAGGAVEGQVRDYLKAALQNDLSDPADYLFNMFRWRAYGVGGSLAWLLDDFTVDGWRSAVEAGTPLDRLLEDAVARAAPDRLEALWSVHDLEERIRQAEPLVEQATSARLDRRTFLALAPRRLVVEIDMPRDQLAAAQISFHSAAMTALEEGGIALPDATQVSVEAGDLVLSARGRSVLLDMPTGILHGERGIYRFTVLLPDLAGLDDLIPGVLEDAVQVTIEGLSLTVPAGAVVEAGEGNLSILVRS